MTEKTKDSLIAAGITAASVLVFILTYVIKHEISSWAIGCALMGILLLVMAQHPRS